MSKPSRRPGREAIKEQKKEKKKVEKELRKSEQAQGLRSRQHTSLSNSKSKYENVEEESKSRTTAVTETVRIYRNKLPVLLKRLSKIDDPRAPKKVKYEITLLMIYGILTFVLQMSSRREANREMTRPMFLENLRILFPELEDIPHNDTLMRLLEKIDVNEIEKAQIDLVRSLIRKKKFKRYLIRDCYPIAIDGTQKLSRMYLWDNECLERKIKDDQKQYYVYVLEASLTFHNGMTIPLMSEFLSYEEGDSELEKQDCELKAFKRLAVRLKSEFKRLSIMLLLDGLYPNGPVMKICRDNHWDFMIVLQDKSLPSVWEEYDGLIKLLPGNFFKQKYCNRRQHFKWVNKIEYYYDTFKKQIVHVVVCEEQWKEVDKKTNAVIIKTSRHAWISSKPIEKSNLHERCNLGARHRWNIESEILAEKKQGYQYEHCFSYDWNAMKGYHYLMRIARILNVLSQYSESLTEFYQEKGVRGFIKFIRQTISGPWLDPVQVQKRMAEAYQLRLI